MSVSAHAAREERPRLMLRSVEVVDLLNGRPVAQMLVSGVSARIAERRCRLQWQTLGYSSQDYMFNVLPGVSAARVTEFVINRNGIRRGNA